MFNPYENMKRDSFDIDTIRPEDLIPTAGLLQAYRQYLMTALHFDRQYAELASEDLRDPYITPYVTSRYEGDVTLANKTYSVNSCYVDLAACDIPGADCVLPFEFLMLFNAEDIPNSTVDEYIAAEKRFIIL